MQFRVLVRAVVIDVTESLTHDQYVMSSSPSSLPTNTRSPKSLGPSSPGVSPPKLGGSTTWAGFLRCLGLAASVWRTKVVSNSRQTTNRLRPDMLVAKEVGHNLPGREVERRWHRIGQCCCLKQHTRPASEWQQFTLSSSRDARCPLRPMTHLVACLAYRDPLSRA